MQNFYNNLPHIPAKISAPHAHFPAFSGAENVHQGPAHLPTQKLSRDSIDRLSNFSNSRSIDQLPMTGLPAEAAQKMRPGETVILTPHLAQSVNSFELAIRELDPESANLLRIAFYARLGANLPNFPLPQNQSARPIIEFTENQVKNTSEKVVDAGCEPQPSFQQLFRPQIGTTWPIDPKFGPSNQTASTNAGLPRNHVNIVPFGHQGKKAVSAPAFPVHHPEESGVCGFQPQIWMQPSMTIPTTPRSTSYGFPIPNYSGKGALDVCRAGENPPTQNLAIRTSKQPHWMQHGETVPTQQKSFNSVNPVQRYAKSAENDANRYVKISDIEASSEFLKRTLQQIRPEPRIPENSKSAQSGFPGQSYPQKTNYDAIPHVNDVTNPNLPKTGHPTHQTTANDEKNLMVGQPHRSVDPIQRTGQHSRYVTPTYSQITQLAGRSQPRLPTYRSTRNDATGTMRKFTKPSGASVPLPTTTKQIQGQEIQKSTTSSEGGHVAYQTKARDMTDTSAHYASSSDLPGSRTLTKPTSSDGLSLPLLGDSSLLALEKNKKQSVLAALQPRLLGQPIPKDRSLASETHPPKKRVRFSSLDGPGTSQRQSGGKSRTLEKRRTQIKSQRQRTPSKLGNCSPMIRPSKPRAMWAMDSVLHGSMAPKVLK